MFNASSHTEVPTYMAALLQCDQIERFLKVLANKFSLKSISIIW